MLRFRWCDWEDAYDEAKERMTENDDPIALALHEKEKENEKALADIEGLEAMLEMRFAEIGSDEGADDLKRAVTRKILSELREDVARGKETRERERNDGRATLPWRSKNGFLQRLRSGEEEVRRRDTDSVGRDSLAVDRSFDALSSKAERKGHRTVDRKISGSRTLSSRAT